MADNFAFTPGAGATGAADDIGGVLYPRVKLDWGTDGTANDVDTAAGKALPVQLRDTSGNEIGTSSHPVRTDPTGTTTQPISAASLPLPPGAATAAKQPALGTAGTASADVITIQGIASMTAVKVDGSSVTQPVSAASLPLPTGAATESTLAGVLTTSDFDTKIGSLTETAPTSDTASSGLNGRLQRIAQRLTSLIALFPTALTGSGNFKVALSESTATVSANTAQVNGVTVSTGNGVSGTGVQRVAVASDNTPFNVAASNETSQVFNGTTALTPKFATVSASSSGATTIITAVTSKKLRVLALQLVANAAVNVKWQSHVTPTDITGLAYLAANGGYVLPYNPVGWFQSVSGEALDINLSGAVAVGGSITYVEV